MLRHETGRDNLPSVNVKLFKALRYGLSAPETGHAVHEAN